MTTDKNPSIPTDATLNMYMQPNSGYHLSQLEWQIEVYADNGHRKRQIIPKSECIRVDEDNYQYYPDTELVGVGKYYAKLTVKIPDPSRLEGYRRLSQITDAGLTICK